MGGTGSAAAALRVSGGTSVEPVLVPEVQADTTSTATRSSIGPAARRSIIVPSSEHRGTGAAGAAAAGLGCVEGTFEFVDELSEASIVCVGEFELVRPCRHDDWRALTRYRTHENLVESPSESSELPELIFGEAGLVGDPHGSVLERVNSVL